MRTPVRVAVVGASPRAAVLARIFDELPQAELRWLCSEKKRTVGADFRTVAASTNDLDDVLRDEDLDAVAFASCELAGGGRALASLAADKHVFVDGLLARTAAEAEALIEVAVQRNRKLTAHSDALLEPGALRLRGLIDRGTLGEIFYLHARKFVLREDASVDLLWDIGADLITLVLDLIGDEPVEVVAQGDSYRGLGCADVVFAELRFATGIRVSLHFSSLEGEMIERVSVVGSESAAVLDHSDPHRELSLSLNGTVSGPAAELNLEQGGRINFRLPPHDSTRLGCGRFLTSIRSPSELQCGRDTSSAVIAVLEALTASCVTGGSIATIASRPVGASENVVAFRAR